MVTHSSLSPTAAKVELLVRVQRTDVGGKLLTSLVGRRGGIGIWATRDLTSWSAVRRSTFGTWLAAVPMGDYLHEFTATTWCRISGR